MNKQVFKEHGVVFSCAAAKVGEKVEITYTGLLKNSGATEVKAHIGYNELWEKAETIEMQLKDDAFVASIELAQAGSLNCAFVDSVGNWDNNSGANYSFTVAKATTKKATSRTKKATENTKATAKTKTTVASKKTASKKAASKKASTKATSTKKSATAKAADTKSTAAKKTTTKKSATTKAATTKAPAKKSTTKSSK